MKKIIFGLFLMLFSFTALATVTYYPMDNGVEIEVPGYNWCIIYDSNYNTILSADHNPTANHYHVATGYAVAVCTTEAEYNAVIMSIDPNYFYGPFFPYPDQPNF